MPKKKKIAKTRKQTHPSADFLSKKRYRPVCLTAGDMMIGGKSDMVVAL